MTDYETKILEKASVLAGLLDNPALDTVSFDWETERALQVLRVEINRKLKSMGAE